MVAPIGLRKKITGLKITVLCNLVLFFDSDKNEPFTIYRGQDRKQRLYQYE